MLFHAPAAAPAVHFLVVEAGAAMVAIRSDSAVVEGSDSLSFVLELTTEQLRSWRAKIPNRHLQPQVLSRNRERTLTRIQRRYSV